MSTDDVEMGARLFDQAQELWIDPEVQRRQEAGLLPHRFVLWAAQVIMNFGRPVEVRLNDEVKAVLKVRVNRPIAKGEQVSLREGVQEVLGVELTEADPNAGHLTLILHQGTWHITFDFRYNAARVAQHLAAAEEFVAGATFALQSGNLRSFTQQMFDATKLLAKGLLIMHDPQIHSTKNHGAVSSKYNLWGKLGNTDRQYVKLLNKLGKLRGPARYLEGTFNLTVDEAQEMLSVAKAMLIDLRNQIPKRHDTQSDGLNPG